MREVEIAFETFKSKNSLCYWYKVKNPFFVAANFVMIQISKFFPSLSLKRLFLRSTGMKIGKNVAIGFSAQFDIFFPELIEIGENTIIGHNSIILTHEFLIDKFRTGKVKIGKNVLIGSNVLILPGVSIGDNSKISSFSLVNKDVKRNSFMGGVPIKRITKR